MPENIMKTLWDESDDLHDETMSTNSVLSDDYTSNDIQDLQETIESENIEDGIESDSIEHWMKAYSVPEGKISLSGDLFLYELWKSFSGF